jgi:phosphoglycolate phosphatase-like HAD superfamily hydrolase
MNQFVGSMLGAITSLLLSFGQAQADPLASWNDGAAKRAIIELVEATTKPASPHFVAPEARIAVFDNDGTLWSEKPAYFQLAFALDRVRALAPQHPEWKTTQPFKAALEGDMKALAAGGEHALLELVMASHAGNTTEEFQSIVGQWLAEARHPTLKRPYTELVYQPQLELLEYLRSSGFKVFIVSGGGIDFLRVFSEEVYGVPRENVVGSSIVTEYKVVEGKPALVRLPKLNFIDDKAGKPVGIHQHIGRRPILAFGNSDGDFEMLEWTTAGEGPRLGLLVHHDDAEREFAYDRESSVGRLNRGLDEAAKRGWQVVSMKNDWKQVYPRQQAN